MTARVFSRLYRRAIVSIILLGTILGLLTTMMPVAAATDAGQGIQVSPIIIDLNGEKSGSYTLKLTVTNVTAGDLVLKSAVNDFQADGESGNPKVILDQNAAPTSYSLKSWVSTIPSITLRSKESRMISVGVQIPSNAEAGGHYGVIRFSGLPPDQSGQGVSLSASVGVLLLARVQGVITENLSLKELSIQKSGHKGGLFGNGPVDIVARVSNTGNVHVKPVGTLTVKDTFGKTVGSYPFGSNSKNVLPQSTRAYSQSFDKRWLFGRYTVQLQAAYGTTGSVLSGSTSFWVIPYKLILLFALIVAVAVLAAKRLVRRYNHHVIRKHQQPTRKH